MGTGISYLNIGMWVAVCVGVFLLVYIISIPSHAPKPQPGAKKLIRQPWDGGEKTGGRGNR